MPPQPHDSAFRTLDRLCRTLAAHGRMAEAMDASRELLRLADHRPDLHSRTIHWAPCDDRLSAGDLLELSRGYARHLPPAAPEPYANGVDPARRLRVGFVSVELCSHSKYFVTHPVLAAFDRANVETFVYADIASPDTFTERCRAAAGCWRDIGGLPDDAAARQIREDGIDILVDLMGHVPRTRLPVLLRKPAPILVEYSEAPSVLPIFDYRFTDAVADPPGTGDAPGAAPIRIEHGFHVYEPPEDLPPIHSAPAPYADRPVFCCFAPAQKLSPTLLETWGSILRAVPDAWLLLKNNAFGDRRVAEAFQRSLAARGVDASRIRCLPPLPRRDWHLLTYNLADVALDTFPYAGVITTCEALWMGAPVVTLCGGHHMARRGASLLASAGLDNLIAYSREEYVATAVDLIRDRDRVRTLRATLRERVSASPLGQPRRLAASMEQAFRDMWRTWCARQRSVASR
jgi:protein O-GlcNAc transferase